MNFENTRRLYELAAEDPQLAQSLEALEEAYTGRMRAYLTALAGRYGIALEPECFTLSPDAEQNTLRKKRLALVGLILRKKPEEEAQLRAFGRRLDAGYAAARTELAAQRGIRLSPEEAQALSLWTGLL